MLSLSSVPDVIDRHDTGMLHSGRLSSLATNFFSGLIVYKHSRTRKLHSNMSLKFFIPTDKDPTKRAAREISDNFNSSDRIWAELIVRDRTPIEQTLCKLACTEAFRPTLFFRWPGWTCSSRDRPESRVSRMSPQRSHSSR